MNQRKTYAGIDTFRFFAAIMVIAIHTSPLASFSATADFFLTRVLCRVAVPFFFMTSGFFLIRRFSENADACKRFVKRTALIYGASILLYLPINLYNAYFTMPHLLPNLIKDLVFDGTLYHLWYLPAAILGALIAYGAVKKLGFGPALIVTGILYLIGLFGDSYYGLAAMVPAVERFYTAMFEVFDHTRNGIFFAPLFFVLGGYLAERSKKKVPPTLSLVGFVLSLGAMLVEAFLLRHYGLIRHDSMYLMLVPCSCFLFSALLSLQGKRLTILRTSSLLIYILHPLVIVLIRFASELLHLEKLLIEQSLIHFLAVAAITVIFAFLAALFMRHFRKPVSDSKSESRSWIELNLENLSHNIGELSRIMPEGCELMAILKAEAYGHGTYPIAATLRDLGVRAFAVATIDEGISLRNYGLKGEILILGYTDPRRAQELRHYHLSQTVFDTDYALQLAAQKQIVNVHIAIDSGMHRLGIPSENADEILAIFNSKYLKVCGIFSHLCVADSKESEDIAYTQSQIAAFTSLLHTLKDTGIILPKVHIQSSYGLLNYPELQCDYARIGISLYGVDSASGLLHKTTTDLRPVLSLRTKVIQLRSLEAGASVGYGRTFVTERSTRLAVLPIGYADGLPRNLSNGRGQAILCGQKVPIVGRVCMDQLIVDVTDVPDVKIGSVATLIGRDGDAVISAEEVAEQAGTITNELLSRLGRRLTIEILS